MENPLRISKIKKGAKIPPELANLLSCVLKYVEKTEQSIDRKVRYLNENKQ